MFQVFEVNSIEELSTYRLAWEELWNRGRSRRFQLSFPWLEAYWKYSGTDRNLKVLVATLAGRVIGILPLVSKKIESRLGPLNVVTYPLDGWGCWFGPVGPNSAATLTAGMRYLSRAKSDWDLLDFSYTDRDRLDLGRTTTAARNIGWSTLERIWQTVPTIQPRESWGQFLDRKRGKKLDRILAAEEELSSHGKVKLKHYRSDFSDRNEMDSFLQAWQDIAQAANGTDLNELPMVLSMAEAAEDSQLLDLSLLTIDNKPVAATVGFVHPHGLEIVRCVCLPDLPAATLSVLLGRLLEQSLLLGDESVEICPACSLKEPARTLWATKMLNSYRYSCTPLTHIRSAALLKYHAATTPRVSQKRISEPLRQNRQVEKIHQAEKDCQTGNARTSPNIAAATGGPPRKTATPASPRLKIYRQ